MQAPTSIDRPSSLTAWLIFGWAVGGVALILLNPILRLSALPIETIQAGLTPVQWGIAAVWTVFMLYSEAYKGFHKQFAPRVTVRAMALAANPSPILVLFAPFMVMGLLHANRKRRIVAWSLLTGIVVLVVLVRQVPSPWRGIIDMGVVLGLMGGLGSVVWFAGRAVAGHPPNVPADLPGE